MEIPAKIRYLGADTTVKSHPNNANNQRAFYETWSDFISLNEDPDLSEPVRAECLLHEIIEMINYKNELKLPHQSITIISEHIFGIIRDNGLDFREPNKQEN